jgi:hypothetical protein
MRHTARAWRRSQRLSVVTTRFELSIRVGIMLDCPACGASIGLDADDRKDAPCRRVRQDRSISRTRAGREPATLFSAIGSPQAGFSAGLSCRPPVLDDEARGGMLERQIPIRSEASHELQVRNN